jgi:nucleoside-diphosphate-sugar epimerase
VVDAVRSASPEVVIHQLTALSNFRNLKKLDEELALTNRLRTEGTKFLLEAAQAARARRFIAQSFTGWPNAREGGPVKTEDDPLDSNPPESMTKTLTAIRQLEAMVVSARNLEGVVLRYGAFYGPGTQISPGGPMVEMVRKRMLPVFGTGAGVWSFIHIDDAARATLLAMERGPSGIYNIVDDDAAPASVWIPALAEVIGARPPRHLPAWIGRLIIGEAGISMMTQIRGSSNAKAKRLLDWKPTYTSWRDGFRRMFLEAEKEAA